MSTGAIITIVVIVVILLVAVAAFAAAGRLQRRDVVGRLTAETKSRDRQARREEARAARAAGTTLVRAPDTELETWTPPDERTIGMKRRQFLNRGILTLFGLGVAGFGGAALSFLWTESTGGFGGKISVGKISDIMQNIQKNNGFYYVPEGKMWITQYPSYALPKAQAVYPPEVLTGMQAGVVALYQKCPHLGCRVPQCVTSQWFECPCHGSQYNQVGEKKGGPAPRGMDRFPMTVSGGSLTVDTNPSTIVMGPPIGTDTTGQEAEGPHCV
ncbi:MAG: Rieske 2Fe-2S domain-containing protein [Mycobacterium sp.]|nr:Rieske 2Fe-2S domain-containing protein [Mycobacterium sp.]